MPVLEINQNEFLCDPAIIPGSGMSNSQLKGIAEWARGDGRNVQR